MGTRRSALLAVAAALSMTVLMLLPPAERLRSLSIDSLFWLRHQVFEPQQQPEDSHAVVVAIDEESYRRPPLEGLPKVLWTPQLATVIAALLDSGAKVIGQDIVLPTMAEAFLPGRDRDYLLALRRGAQDGRIVLGRIQHSAQPVSPHPSQAYAVGPENIRLLNLHSDPDGIVRGVPTRFQLRQGDRKGEEPGFALELAARYLDSAPEALQPETPRLLLNFSGGGRDIPVHSFADILACAEAGDNDYLRKHFGGKAVILGAALDKEDRILTSARFVTAADGVWFAPRCVHPVMESLYADTPVRPSIPGTLVFATALNNLADGTQLKPAGRGVTAGAIWLLALAAALVLTFERRAGRAAALALGLCLAWTALATVAFQYRQELPLYQPILAAALTFGLVLAQRYGLLDSQKRQLRRAFALYLPPAVIDRMTAENRLPELGGETKELSVLFSDLAGFTSLSETLPPAEVVALMNRYLTAMTDTIEAQGGFVDKFVGDAVIAVFGAPLEDPDHARHAVAAALACQARLARLREEEGLDLHMRIGVNTGQMLIGNIGSARRFNYTVMGDAVNLAARLESANKEQGTEILVSETTRAACGEAFAFQEIGRIAVKGRAAEVTVYAPCNRETADSA
ncbi:MAG: adenylate/guanylate cyclase domain-containing protein [Rhodovibrionaceae bacterium]